MLAFGGATGGIVFGVEVEDYRLAAQGAQLESLASRGREFEIGCGRSCRFIRHADESVGYGSELADILAQFFASRNILLPEMPAAALPRMFHVLDLLRQRRVAIIGAIGASAPEFLIAPERIS